MKPGKATRPARLPELNLDLTKQTPTHQNLDKYDEAILIGLKGNAAQVTIKAATDGTMNKTALVNILQNLLRNLTQRN